MSALSSSGPTFTGTENGVSATEYLKHMQLRLRIYISTCNYSYNIDMHTSNMLRTTWKAHWLPVVDWVIVCLGKVLRLEELAM